MANAGNWWETIKVKGNLRYRHEVIERGEKDARHRHRIRARLAILGKVNENTKVGVQLATGSDDPVSTNQTLDNSFSTKNIMLDLAYFQFSPSPMDGLTITGGKFKNPFFKPGKSELLWDSDLNPEGGFVNFSQDFDDFSMILIGAGLWIDERSSDKDSWIGAGQAVLRYSLNEKKSSLAFGGGFFDYVNTAGFQPFFDDEPMGNMVDSDGNYLNDYEIAELFIEANHKFGKIPVTVMGDFVTNLAADSLNQGWLIGIRVGKTKNPGSRDFRYIYREVKRDAVVGTFTDSDFRGGGTDAKGHEVGGGYQIAGNMKFSATYFVNSIGLETERSIDFNRLQADLQLKF